MGDQITCAPPPLSGPDEVLRLGTASRMRGDWASARFSVTRKGLAAHLGLAREALWVGYRGELRCYPLRSLTECKQNPRGDELRLSFRAPGRQAVQSFTFAKREECQTWFDTLLRMKNELGNSTSEEKPIVVPLIFL